MKIKDMRNLPLEDLAAKVASCKEEIAKLNFQRRVGQVDKPHRFREARRTIARALTLMAEAKPKSRKGKP
jgi:large subunit ribosomal protein L29